MKKRKVIITKLPQAKSGVEVKLEGLRAGLGFNANVMPWPIMAGKMSAPDTEVRKTLGPVPRHMANLEAEKDEVAMIPDKGGIPSTFMIGGKRHHSGGTPLFLPSDSFIFSDTAKMRIKDPNILAQFGMKPKKSGYTPAEIAKKYDVNEYKKVLADPYTDKLQRDTAELMIANNNLKLAKLAIYQESMKGFPQGMPQVGMPYVEEMGVDPAQFVQENPGEGEDETAEADNMSRYGGPHFIGGGSNTFNEFSPNAGAGDAYAGVKGVEGKPLTGNYQDWEQIAKNKAGLSGVAKAEGVLGILGAGTAIANSREAEALKKKMKEASFYDKGVNPIEATKGRYVQTGMATGSIDPYNTGNLVQQPGMNYATEAISKFGGDIDYFAEGGYLPMAQAGLNTGGDKYALIDKWIQEEEAKKAQRKLDKAAEEKNYTIKALDAGISRYEQQIKDLDKEIDKNFGYAQSLASSKGPSWASFTSVADYKDTITKIRKQQQELAGYVNNLKNQKQALMGTKKKYTSEAEYKADLLTPYSPEKRQAQVDWLSAQPSTIAPYKQAADKTEMRQSTEPETAKDTASLAKQQEEKLKQFQQSQGTEPATQPSQEKKQAAPKQSSSIRVVNEDWKEGGEPGKRRVIIHSLGEYKTGGALPKAQDGDAGKTIKEWVKSGKTGKYRPLYTDGSYGPVQDDVPLMIKPYKGADAPSKYSEDDWRSFAQMTGFKPKSETSQAQNLEFQEYLSEHPDFKDEVNRLHTVHGIPTKTGKKFDSLIGKRWDLILDKKPPVKPMAATPPVKEDKKKTETPDKGVYADKFEYPRVPGVAPRFTTQDIIKSGNLAADYLGLKGFYPWSAKPAVYTPDTTFESPERQYAAIAENFNTAAQALSQFGSPAQYNARLSELQGNALKGIADTAARVEARNVDRANQRDAMNADILNRYAQSEAARKTSDFDKYQTVNDTLYNQKRFARNAMANQLVQAVTNRSNIYNLNQLHPQYAVDPSGMFYFKNPRAIKPDYTQQKTISDYYNEVLNQNPNLANKPEIALKMAESMAGIKPTTSEYDEWTKARKGVIPSYASNVNPYGYTEES